MLALFFASRAVLRRGAYGALLVATGLSAAGCAVYDDELPEQRLSTGGAAGSSGMNNGGAGSTLGAGGATGGEGGTAGNGTGGTAGTADGSMTDAPSDVRRDLDAPSSFDTRSESPPDAPIQLDDGSLDGYSYDVADATDEAFADVAADVSSPPADGTSDAPASTDADGATADVRDAVETGAPDVYDAGTTLPPQTLPKHGTPILKPDAGAPFESRCASDEVVTGFTGRAGVQTDAIGATCSKLIGGVLSSPRNLPLFGNLTGGSPFTVTCPSNHVAVGIVGRYGHSTMWNEDITTMIGVVCKNLGSSATQIVTITGQAALDSGYTSFREDCAGGRYLTVISGTPDSNSLAYTVGQVGGECNVR